MLEVDTKGYADMDAVMAFLNSLPKVQRAIVHTLLSEEIPMNEKQREELNRLRAQWMYK